MKNKGKKYELMYSECSRLFCTSQKIDDDAVKLWRETNDSMYWVYKGCRPEKDEFGIIGLQVAGPLLRLTVLIRDGASVDQYYHLHESEIPVQYSDSCIVAEFIKTLLILHNILIVNMTLIPHGSLPKSERQKENSSTVDSDSD
ncbi:8165_t:CDS:1 [Dentiscutata erythropus]|uniref:8165_t:CDS:1 n=1 Tax=Dentiscutata erythropus TaxID=1348616 RepID=A0A9N9IXL3_9GLOM|nr:8165_t:CDS:1 [Dentiscutata erythropus]